MLLPLPRLTEHRDKLAGHDAQAHAAQHGHVQPSKAVGLVQVFRDEFHGSGSGADAEMRRGPDGQGKRWLLESKCFHRVHPRRTQRRAPAPPAARSPEHPGDDDERPRTGFRFKLGILEK